MTAAPLRPSAAGGGGSPSTRVSLSSDVRLVDSIRDGIDPTPVFDVEKVERLKAALRDGSYRPDPVATAGGILDEAVMVSAYEPG